MNTELLNEELVTLQCENAILKENEERLQKRLDVVLDEIQNISKQCSSSESMLAVLQNEIEEKTAYIKSLEAENTRMNKILTGRSDSDRNIKSKKGSSGYILKKCHQVADTYKTTFGYNTVTCNYICWEYVIETPYKYEVTQSENWICHYILQNEDLFGDGNLTYIENNKDDVLNDVFNNNDFSANYAYDLRLELNTHTGFWLFSIKTLYQINAEYTDKLLVCK